MGRYTRLSDMILSQDELRKVFEEYVRFTIDAAQGMNYFLNSKYPEGVTNILKSIQSLEGIVEKVKS